MRRDDTPSIAKVRLLLDVLYGEASGFLRMGDDMNLSYPLHLANAATLIAGREQPQLAVGLFRDGAARAPRSAGSVAVMVADEQVLQRTPAPPTLIIRTPQVPPIAVWSIDRA